MTIEHDVPATMRDGVVLRADVYRPTADGPWPVLLARLPYGKNQPMLAGLMDPVGRARRGFLVVVQDTRGRYASDGEWEPWTYEMDDGYDTVRWAAALPGSNGSVGMFGPSYLGNTQWMAALAKPPELKAISPMVTWSEPDDGLFARGGAQELGITVPWSLMQGVDTLLRRYAGDPMAQGQALMALVGDTDAVAHTTYWELPAGHHPVFERHGIPELGFERSRREPEWSDSCRVAGRQAEIDLPSLHTGGWYDIFSQGTLDNFTAMRAAGRPANLIMGPWSHTGTMGYLGDVNFGMAASTELLGFRGRFADLELGWLRRWLSPGDEPSQPELPPVLLFVMGTNQWREEQEWPLARAVDTDLFLRAGNRLAFDAPETEEETGAFTYDSADPVPTTGGALLMSNEFPPGPLDQAKIEARPDVLLYTTDPLADDLEVTGRVRAHLTAATDAPTTDWVVRLCDVDTRGVSRNVVDGIVRAVATPGEFTEQVVDLWSTSYVFRAGHRIRVHVTSSNFPRWDRNLNTGEPLGTQSRPARQVIAHDASRLSRVVLPVVPAPAEGRA
ncbi:CocE/NonD family hydrolase [Amycolatopsis mediterranei]|uniref:X-Pro dipeptidyl-peptidase n=1 Tax=Amycolatopsis mediterranei (strain S699) TaxID=713604 RepID=A0A9R0NSQ8_AMYMS|nr:CocE/NonD family hydrolase [Amycolatopsis mediterranei]AEK39978.1 X-Pro dipeptidyl-peptidase [Amycolatopsis mediterranei S699]UZF68505.1 CocE/NonD family hydrolase [Amycolatopsis mediterranei]